MPVLAYHAEFSMLSGGFVGVDIFFVISGFLITSLIQEDLKSGTFSFSSFYERRARRLGPALVAVVSISFLVAVFILPPSDLSRFAASVISSLFSFSNILFWQETSYFAPNADLKPLLHTWSLSIEEQYYLLFPAAMATAYKYRISTMQLCMLLFCGSFALALAITPHFPSAAFYLLPTRLWELAAGAIAALLPAMRLRTGWPKSFLAASGLGMILWSFSFFDISTQVPGPLLVIPILGTALVLILGQGDTLVGRLMSLPIFVGIGLISYSLYLVHQPLFVFTRMLWVGELPIAVSFLMIGVALALATLSWRFIECPFRRSSIQTLLPERSAFLITLAVVVVTLTASAIWTRATDGFAERFDPGLLAKVQAIDDITRIRACTASFSATEAVPCIIGSAAKDAQMIAVLGDSHASQWLPAFELMAKQQNWKIALFSKSSCPSMSVSFIAPELKREYWECSAWRQSAVEQIQTMKPDLVLLTNSSEGYLSNLGTNNLTPTEWQSGTQTVVSALLPHVDQVAILRDNPQFRNFDPRLCVARALLLKTVNLERCAERQDVALGTQASRVERSVQGAAIIDLSDRYCRNGWCYLYEKDNIVMRDNNHLSLPMVQYLSKDLSHILESLIYGKKE